MSGMMIGAAAAVGGGLDPDAAAFIARFTVEPDDIRKNAINDFFVAIKDAGIFAKLDSLFVAKKGQDTQSMLLDWERSDTATLFGTASVDATDGFTSPNGTNTDYILSGYTPSVDGVNFTANNAGVGCLITDTPKNTASGRIFGSRGSDASNTTTLLQLRYDAGTEETYFNTSEGYINGAGGFTEVDRVPASSLGVFQVNRTASNQADVYYCGVKLATNTNDSATRAVSPSEFPLGSYNDNGDFRSYNVTKQAAWWFGAPLTPVEQSALGTALDNYFSAL